MELDVQSLNPVTMTELKAKLESLKGASKDVNFRAGKVLEFLNELHLIDAQRADELKKKIAELNVPRLKEKHIVKIIDLMPATPDDLKALLVGENITVKQDDLVRIVDVLKS